MTALNWEFWNGQMIWLVPISGRVDPTHLSLYVGEQPCPHDIWFVFFLATTVWMSWWGCTKEYLFNNSMVYVNALFVKLCFNLFAFGFCPDLISLLHLFDAQSLTEDAKLPEELAWHPTPCINFCGLLRIRNCNWADTINYTCAPCSDPLHTICACLILQRW